MTAHPGDEAFLDSLPWDASWGCEHVEHLGPTVAVGHVEACSGPGFELRHCRGCVGLYLARARALAEQRGEAFAPALPPWS